ncbi:hypothetical protein [Mucilaginibacter sp.]|nr:hypothetical protein [Mucilaginibacter sp.]MDB4922938.1 hypothetical protein [Mucilaginibacter sp.]
MTVGKVSGYGGAAEMPCAIFCINVKNEKLGIGKAHYFSEK